MKKLYLMRHGETQYNVENKIQGWCDSPLTTEGQKQALRANDYFINHGIVFDHAYCSPSQRAIDTLKLAVGMPYETLEGLREMHYGQFEGQSAKQTAHLKPHDYETFFLDYGGESSNHVQKRMIKTLREIMEKENHRVVFVVSHSGACFNFIRAFQNPNGLKFANGTIFVCTYENGQFSLENQIVQEEMEKEYEIRTIRK